MFRDERRYEVWDEIRQHDIRSFSRQMTSAVFADAAKRAEVKLGKGPLYAVNLVWLGISAALHATVSFACVLTMTLRILEDQEHFAKSKLGKAQKKGRSAAADCGKRSRHDPRRGDPTVVSEEAFAKARQRMPLEFWIQLVIVLGERFEAEHGALLKFHGLRLLALDGTRLDLPNWKSLKDYYGTASNKGGQHNAQARMVMLQFPFVRLPYRYEVSPVKIGEITLALRLVPHLRSKDLVLLDAGYWSYGLLCAIQKRGAFFAIRLRKGLTLKTIRCLGTKDRLVRWAPKDSRGNWRKQDLPKSIDLRAIEYRVPGFRTQAIITNVLNPQRVSREDWTRLTTESDAGRKLLPGLFHRRWEIETTFHELKVDQGLDRHLRSRKRESIEYEIAGHVVLYLLVRWLMVEAAVKHGLDPLRLSFVHALHELETMRPSLICASPRWAALTLVPRLLDRIAANQVPSRPGRHYPRKKKKSTKARQDPKAKKVKKKG
jgi:hypothetical protein